MKELIIESIINVLFFYFQMIGYDWYIGHNELEIKKVKPNKYFSPICYLIAKSKGKYAKLELLYIITEAYAHSILIIRIISLILIQTMHIEWLSKYIFIGSLFVFAVILIVCRIINKIKRKQ